jgi:uncharacterized ferritin-like protein (DUF455 family)
MNTINDYCLHILRASTLEDKLIPPPKNLVNTVEPSLSFPNKPSRPPNLEFSDKKQKIPRLEHLNTAINRALTLHHFANHELMAIELFAYALLKFQTLPETNKREFLKTITEEQKHLRLYIKRMNELGLDFGDKPVNYIFWKYTPMMQTPETFSAIMSLSFEGANLDYSILYQHCFESFGDEQSGSIMEVIYRDEIKHVKRGLDILRASKPEGVTDWFYYSSLLSYPFTPRRAKGYIYVPMSREKAGLDDSFITNLAQYTDEFSNRKPEIIPQRILEAMKEKGVVF